MHTFYSIQRQWLCCGSRHLPWPIPLLPPTPTPTQNPLFSWGLASPPIRFLRFIHAQCMGCYSQSHSKQTPYLCTSTLRVGGAQHDIKNENVHLHLISTTQEIISWVGKRELVWCVDRAKPQRKSTKSWDVRLFEGSRIFRSHLLQKV